MGYCYTIIQARITNDCEVEIIGKRKQIYISTARLNVGGLYFLKPNKLYKVLTIEEVTQ